MMKLKFQSENAKLSNMAIFSLPAGHSCPFAKECLSRAHKLTGKIIDGQHCRYRCFAAMEERYPSVRQMRWGNFEMLRAQSSVESLTELINNSLPSSPLVRIHASGDFFNERYFLAWLNVAQNNSLVTFYAYTKALPFWVKYRKWIPNNFRLIASYGGTHDHLIGKYHLRYARVVFSEQAAADLGLELDHTDSIAYMTKKSFGLLLHGCQPKSTEAAQAWWKIFKAGGGYSLKKKNQIPQRETKIYITLKSGEIFLPQKAKTAERWWASKLVTQ